MTLLYFSVPLFNSFHFTVDTINTEQHEQDNSAFKRFDRLNVA